MGAAARANEERANVSFTCAVRASVLLPPLPTLVFSHAAQPLGQSTSCHANLHPKTGPSHLVQIGSYHLDPTSRQSALRRRLS